MKKVMSMFIFINLSLAVCDSASNKPCVETCDGESATWSPTLGTLPDAFTVTMQTVTYWSNERPSNPAYDDEWYEGSVTGDGSYEITHGALAKTLTTDAYGTGVPSNASGTRSFATKSIKSISVQFGLDVDLLGVIGVAADGDGTITYEDSESSSKNYVLNASECFDQKRIWYLQQCNGNWGVEGTIEKRIYFGPTEVNGQTVPAVIYLQQSWSVDETILIDYSTRDDDPKLSKKCDSDVV